MSSCSASDRLRIPNTFSFRRCYTHAAKGRTGPRALIPFSIIISAGLAPVWRCKNKVAQNAKNITKSSSTTGNMTSLPHIILLHYGFLFKTAIAPDRRHMEKSRISPPAIQTGWERGSIFRSLCRPPPSFKLKWKGQPAFHQLLPWSPTNAPTAGSGKGLSWRTRSNYKFHSCSHGLQQT